MILKLVKTPASREVFFDGFDGFDHVTTFVIDRKEVEKDYGCPVSIYFGDDDKKVLQLNLSNTTNCLVRVVYLGACCIAYLLSNDGHTIERIN